MTWKIHQCILFCLRRLLHTVPTILYNEHQKTRSLKNCISHQKHRLFCAQQNNNVVWLICIQNVWNWNLKWNYIILMFFWAFLSPSMQMPQQYFETVCSYILPILADRSGDYILTTKPYHCNMLPQYESSTILRFLLCLHLWRIKDKMTIRQCYHISVIHTTFIIHSDLKWNLYWLINNYETLRDTSETPGFHRL